MDRDPNDSLAPFRCGQGQANADAEKQQPLIEHDAACNLLSANRLWLNVYSHRSRTIAADLFPADEEQENTLNDQNILD